MTEDTTKLILTIAVAVLLAACIVSGAIKASHTCVGGGSGFGGMADRFISGATFGLVGPGGENTCNTNN